LAQKRNDVTPGHEAGEAVAQPIFGRRMTGLGKPDRRSEEQQRVSLGLAQSVGDGRLPRTKLPSGVERPQGARQLS
jgi:hypothetical protein